jgi:hypothetical protein
LPLIVVNPAKHVSQEIQGAAKLISSPETQKMRPNAGRNHASWN